MNEILAPAGDEQSAVAAIHSGADAVYLGYSAFSARAAAANFDLESLARIVRYAHLLKVKIYVAMNILVKDSELAAFCDTFSKIYACGADAFIIQDIFLGKYLHQVCPQAELHLSTQAGVNNVHGAWLAKAYGFRRVILARETPLADIRAIADVLETEVFVQGALCTCVSGQCYFSSFVGGNSGNRGRCKQPCRKRYAYDRAGYDTVSYALSPSDLSVREKILALRDAGVYSFKIEGRMRRPSYVAAAVSYYRNLLDGKDAQEAFHALKRAYNRGDYTYGLAFGQGKDFLSRNVQGHIGERIGVLRQNQKGWLCSTSERGREGDAYKILRNGEEVCGARFLASQKGGILIKPSGKPLPGDEVRITTCAEKAPPVRKRICKIALQFSPDDFPKAVYGSLVILGDDRVLPAQKAPLRREDVAQCFAKTGSPLSLETEIQLNGNCFLTKAMLNAFRRKVVAAIEESLLCKRSNPILPPLPLPPSGRSKGELAVIASEFSFETQVDYAIFKPYDYANGREYDNYFAFAKRYASHSCLYLPAIFSAEDEKLVAPHLDGFEYLYTEGTYGIVLAEKYGKKMFAGTGFNIANRLDILPFPYVVSKELNAIEQLACESENAFVLQCGALKLMDFAYCPFEKTCKTCDRRNWYHLTDEDGRVFPVRRYQLSSCRFELLNCHSLVNAPRGGSVLIDLTGVEHPQAVLSARGDVAELKGIFGSFTAGHEKNSVI